MPRRREGPPRIRGLPRHEQLRLGEPGDKTKGLSGLPRRGVARLGEPLHLCVPMIVRGLCLWPVSGRSYSSIYDCCDLLRGPLCDYWSVSLLD